MVFHGAQSPLEQRAINPCSMYWTVGSCQLQVFLVFLGGRSLDKIKKQRKKRRQQNAQRLTVPVCLGKHVPEISSGQGARLLWLSVNNAVCGNMSISWSFGEMRNTTTVEYKLDSMMKTSGCKFQNYLVSLLVSSTGRKPDCSVLISKSLWHYLAMIKCRNLN